MSFQISDNSFVVPPGSNSLRPSTKVGVEMTDGQTRPTTSFNGLDTSDYLDGQTKPTTLTSDTDKEGSDVPGTGSGSNETENINSILNRPDFLGNSTVSSSENSTQIDGSEVATTLRPDPSPRIGTSTEIYVNGTEVFPAYTVFGEPCKGIIIT